MTQRLPQNFKRINPPAIASYNYVDIAEGTGVVIYYGAQTNESNTDDYILTTQTPYSNEKTTQGQASQNGEHQILDIDFDIEFTLPKIIQGTVIGQIPWVSGNTNTTNRSGGSYCIMKVRHWDGTTETDLATAQTEDHDVSDLEADGTVKLTYTTISTPQKFKAGETLRITVELWNADNGLDNQPVSLCHDPKDRTLVNAVDHATAIDTAPDSTQMAFYIPFKLDIE